LTELSREFDGKARDRLRELLSREQMMRLYQVRMPVRWAVDSLANQRVAGSIQLTEEQQQQIAQIAKDVEAKPSGFGEKRLVVRKLGIQTKPSSRTTEAASGTYPNLSWMC
jgi:hypothetical protein